MSGPWTPGPWRVSGKGTVRASRADGTFEEWVAQVSRWNRSANARLIAASPTMADLLERAIPALWFMAATGNADAVAMHNEARALLSRIRGETP